MFRDQGTEDRGQKTVDQRRLRLRGFDNRRARAANLLSSVFCPLSSDPRVPVKTLSFGAAALAALLTWEGFSETPYVPTKGDVPTIGYGSTFYEDGATVKLTDPPITRSHAEKLARGVLGQFEVAFRQSLDGASLTQYEYDAYLDFSYQFGLGAWRGSSMRRFVLAGDYGKACDALLLWKKQAGRDCSLPKNWGPQGCKGVWSRQMERHAKCMGEAAK